MRVCVTGGAGFIGSNLCRRLLVDRDIDEVRVVDDLSTGYATNLAGLNLTFIEGSILDRVALGEAVAGVDAVVHLAALGSVPRSVLDPLTSHEVNATGTLRVLEAARARNAHVVLASSSSVYGANATLPKSEDLTCMPMSPYAVSKLATEQYAVSYASCYGLPVLPFRFFNVYGPLQRAGHAYAAVIPAFIDAALRGRPVNVFGDGMQSRDFTYVGTVVEILTRSVLSKMKAGPTNLAFGSRATLLDVIALVSEELGRHVEVRYSAQRAGDVKHSQANCDQLLELFPDVQAVPLRSGISDTVAWMRGTMA
jgi:UDP-glucose 4-epimerase